MNEFWLIILWIIGCPIIYWHIAHGPSCIADGYPDI